MRALGETWFPYCGAAPPPAEWFSRWNLDPLLIGAIAAAWLFARLHSPASARTQWTAAALSAVLFVSPLCALGSALFAFRVSHHLILSFLLAPLLAAVWDGIRASRLSLPLITAVQSVAFWVWHVPQIYESAMQSGPVFWVMQISITGTSFIWWAALRRATAMAAAANLLASMVSMGLLGALIVFAGRPLYAPHWAASGAWGLSPVEDQQIAGLLMWVVGGGAYLLIAAAMLYRSLGPSAPARAA